MLLRYFGFKEDPFGATPDPRFLYYSHTHREALASLQYAFYCNRGFTTLIAPPGMGKTTLLFRFLEDIKTSARSAFLFDSQCDPQELVSYILRDIGIIPGPGNAERHEQLNAVLIAEARAGRKFVVVIDEAQNLSEGALETVRLLTNFETPRAKLMQIVLAGQPLLPTKLMQPSLVQLRQRISTLCRLEPFSINESTAYIAHRLKLAGYDGRPLFTEDALNRISEQSQGIPRVINNLCFNALSLCRGLKMKQVDGRMVAEVIRDQHLVTQPETACGEPYEVALKQPLPPNRTKQVVSPAKHWVPAFAALLVLCVVGVSGIVWLHRTRSVHVHRTDVTQAASTTARLSDMGNFSGHSPQDESVEVEVQPRQTLSDIATRHLGNFDVEVLHRIQALNPTMSDPDLIQPGQKIRLPKQAPMSAKADTTLQGHVRKLL